MKKEKMTQISCGWGLLPLFTADGGPVENKTYEIKLYGGTPFEKDVGLGSGFGRLGDGGGSPRRGKRCFCILLTSEIARNVTQRLVGFCGGGNRVPAEPDRHGSNTEVECAGVEVGKLRVE